MMRRRFAELTLAIFRTLYLAMVRPQLDYAVQAVAPYLQSYLKLVERMQRVATRCVKGLRGLQYPARLRELRLPSMQSHILRTTLITAYKLFHGNMNLLPEEFFEAPAVNHLRGHLFKIRQPRFQLARRQAAFAVRVVGPRNRLPHSVAEAPSLNVFKEGLDSCWVTIFPDLSYSPGNLFMVEHGFGTKMVFSRPVNFNSDS